MVRRAAPMATGDGGLLVLGGSSGSLVVSLHGLVVSVVSCSSLPRLPLVSSFFSFFLGLGQQFPHFRFHCGLSRPKNSMLDSSYLFYSINLDQFDQFISSPPRLLLGSSSSPPRLLQNLACAGPFNRGPNQSA